MPGGDAAAAREDAAPVRFRRQRGRAGQRRLADARQSHPANISVSASRSACCSASCSPSASSLCRRSSTRCARSGSATAGCCACPMSIAFVLLALQPRHRRLRPALRPICLCRAALRAELGRARRLDQGRRVHQSRPADDPAGRAQRERGAPISTACSCAPRAAAAGRSRSPPTAAPSSPPTIPTRSCFRLTNGRLVHDAPGYRAPRVLSFVQPRSADQPAGDRDLPRPRQRHQGADPARARPDRPQPRRSPSSGATRSAPISISAWSRW